MTADVVAFLQAALDETERAARAAIADQCANDEWTVDSDEDSDGQFRRATVFTTGSYSTVADMADPDGNEPTAAHIALHDPRAVLARVEAECSILAMHDESNTEPGLGLMEFQWGQVCGTCAAWAPLQYRATEYRTEAVRLWPCDTLRTLAYGHRHTVPGYDPAWAPDGARAAR